MSDHLPVSIQTIHDGSRLWLATLKVNLIENKFMVYNQLYGGGCTFLLSSELSILLHKEPMNWFALYSLIRLAWVFCICIFFIFATQTISIQKLKYYGAIVHLFSPLNACTIYILILFFVGIIKIGFHKSKHEGVFRVFKML